MHNHEEKESEEEREMSEHVLCCGIHILPESSGFQYYVNNFLIVHFIVLPGVSKVSVLCPPVHHGAGERLLQHVRGLQEGEKS